MLHSLLSDARFGLRQLLSRPGLTVAAILTLALGLGANTAIFSMVQGLVYGTVPFEDVDRLTWIGEHSEQVPSMSVSFPNFDDWRARSKSFEALAAHRYTVFNVVGDGPPMQIVGVFASPELFRDVLRVDPVMGRAFEADDNRRGAPKVVLLSFDYWQRQRGADPDIVGSTMTIDGTPHEVIGVMPRGFVYPIFTRELAMWMPLESFEDPNQTFYTSRGNHPGMYVTGRLKDGVPFESAREDLESIAAALATEYPDTNTGNGISIAPLRDQFVQYVAPALALLSGAVFLVLLMACVNVANLLLARGAGRAQEIAVRTALGASRWRVVRQLLAESVLLSTLGGLAGLVMAWGALRWLHASVDFSQLPAFGEIALDRQVFAFGLALSVLTGLVFGLAPALQALRHDVNGALKDGAKGSAGGTKQRLRSGLVVVQVTVALVLLVGALLFLQSFRNVVGADPGFDAENAVVFDLRLDEEALPDDASRVAFYDALLERMSSIPGVTSAAATLPLLGGWQTQFLVEGQPIPAPGEGLSVDITRVTAGYFDAMGVEVQKGRGIDASDRADSRPVAVIDRTFADTHFEGVDPIGKRVKLGDPEDESRPWFEIVGVVDHVKNYGVKNSSRVEMYVPMTQDPREGCTVVLRTAAGDPLRLVPEAQRELMAVSQTVPLARPRLLRAEVDGQTLGDRMLAGLLSLFAVVAVTLAALGLYGVMAFTVAQRRREIGIRMALGAAFGDVVRLISSHALRLVAVGVGAGLLLLYWALPLLESQLFGVAPRDPKALVGVPLLLLAVGALACLVPLRRASRVEPSVTLRYE